MRFHRIAASTAALLATTTIATAGGLDRSGQSVSSIFNDDGTAGFSIGYVMPSVTGTDYVGTGDYDVGQAYTQTSASYTNRISDAFSYAVIYDQPYGANIEYGNDPLTSALGGTMADLSTHALNLIGRYQITDRISVFGGVSAE